MCPPYMAGTPFLLTKGVTLMSTRDSVLELKNRMFSSITRRDQAGSDLQRNNLNGGLVGTSGISHCTGAAAGGQLPEDVQGIPAEPETGSGQPGPGQGAVVPDGLTLGARCRNIGRRNGGASIGGIRRPVRHLQGKEKTTWPSFQSSGRGCD